MRRWLLPILFLTSLGCSNTTDDEARSTWLQQTLVEDNYTMIQREPHLTAGKFLKMRATPYNFFRGTAPQFHRDFSQAHEGRINSGFTTTKSSMILLVGDPHPENIGTFRSGDAELVMEFNDFDASRFGSYLADVYRLALGFRVAGEQVEQFAEDELRGLSERVAEGYFDHMTSNAPSELQLERSGVSGAVARDLFRRAERDGSILEELQEYTRLEDGKRTPWYGTLESSEFSGVIGDETREVERVQADALRSLLSKFCLTTVGETCSQAKLKGMSQRFGGGVSSYPVQRYYVLIEGLSDSPDDDVLLEAKEILDAPRIQRLPVFPARRFKNNAERVVQAQRALQVADDADPYLGWVASDGYAFRVRHRTKYQKGFSVDRMVNEVLEQNWTHEDVSEFAYLAGRLLAASHARGPMATGEESVPAIREAIGTEQRGFVDEVATFAAEYAGVVREDGRRFSELLDDAGPLLGIRVLR